jgi:hypothetical protein
VRNDLSWPRCWTAFVVSTSWSRASSPSYERPSPSDSADSGARIDRLGAELEAHLDYEEEYLVPVLNAMTSLPGH